MISQRFSRVVPDSRLKFLKAAVLPMVIVNWICLSPGLDVGLLLESGTETGILLRPLSEHAIAFGVVSVAVINCHKIVHVWIEKIIQMSWRHVISKICVVELMPN